MSEKNPSNEQLIEKHVPYARNLAERFCQRRGIEDRDTVDDYESEALLALVREGRKFRPDEGMKFRTFIHQRMTWALLRYHKASQPDFVFITGYHAMDDEDDDDSLVDVLDTVHDGWYEPYRMAVEGERDDFLDDLVEGLTPHETRTVRALYYEDKSLDEAESEGIGSRTAISRFKHSALRKLRVRWKRCSK